MLSGYLYFEHFCLGIISLQSGYPKGKCKILFARSFFSVESIIFVFSDKNLKGLFCNFAYSKEVD